MSMTTPSSQPPPRPAQAWLVKGSVSVRTMTSLRTDAECPSISPDRTRVAFKTRLGNPAPGQWSIAVLNLATGAETVLAERRSVDDQVEWLDDRTVLYALPVRIPRRPVTSGKFMPTAPVALRSSFRRGCRRRWFGGSGPTSRDPGGHDRDHDGDQRPEDQRGRLAG